MWNWSLESNICSGYLFYQVVILWLTTKATSARVLTTSSKKIKNMFGFISYWKIIKDSGYSLWLRLTFERSFFYLWRNMRKFDRSPFLFLFLKHKPNMYDFPSRSRILLHIDVWKTVFILFFLKKYRKKSSFLLKKLNQIWINVHIQSISKCSCQLSISSYTSLDVKRITPIWIASEFLDISQCSILAIVPSSSL